MVRIENINGKEIKIPWKNKKSNRKPNHEIEETWTHETIRIDLKKMTHNNRWTITTLKKIHVTTKIASKQL